MPSFRFRVRVVLSADGDVGVEFGYVPAAVAGMPGIFRSSTAGARCSELACAEVVMPVRSWRGFGAHA